MKTYFRIAYTTVLVFGIMIFMAGMHNIDNSFNLKYVNCRFSEDIVDISMAGIEITANEGYRTGSIFVFSGVMLSLVASFYLFSSIGQKSGNSASINNNS